jgi:hypothetical protein
MKCKIRRRFRLRDKSQGDKQLIANDLAGGGSIVKKTDVIPIINHLH